MQTLKSRLYRLLIRRAMGKLRKLQLPLLELRRARELQAAAAPARLAGVQAQSQEIAGLACERLTPLRKPAEGLVLYLHGGAYFMGSINTHRGFVAKLAEAAGQACLLLDYRRAPEHPFPAALDDAFAVYRALQERHPGVPISVAGDSAGGGLALALALRIRDAGLTPPAALALMSPWTDLSLSNPSHVSKAAVDPFFPDPAFLREAAAMYAAGQDLRSPLLSPQFADLAGLPATLIHVGTHEVLLDDARVLAEQMNRQGSPATLKIYPGMWHSWQELAGRLREADESMAELGAFLKQTVAGRTPPQYLRRL